MKKTRDKYENWEWRIDFTINMMSFMIFASMTMIMIRSYSDLRSLFNESVAILIWASSIFVFSDKMFMYLEKAMDIIPKLDKKGVYWEDD